MQVVLLHKYTVNTTIQVSLLCIFRLVLFSVSTFSAQAEMFLGSVIIFKIHLHTLCACIQILYSLVQTLYL